MKPGVIILAAGPASRMQKPKMLLPIGNDSLLGHILQETRLIQPLGICLVTGYYHDEIIQHIDTRELDIVFNKNWKKGMSDSIRSGLSALLAKHPGMDSAYILVSDQPYLNRDLLLKMQHLSITANKGIIAAEYENTTGTPVLFNREYFSELLKLKGDKGAKTILQQNESDLLTVAFPLGAMDIDTPGDYERFCFQNKQPHA